MVREARRYLCCPATSGDDGGVYGAGTWIRNPVGYRRRLKSSGRSDLLGEARAPVPNTMKSMTVTAPEPRQRSATAEQILDLAETLIQVRAATARSAIRTSLMGLASARPASTITSRRRPISALAVVDRYAERFGRRARRDRSRRQSNRPWRCSITMPRPTSQLAKTPDKVCLCGALAGEMMALPPELRTRVDAFFKEHQDLAHWHPGERCRAR